MTALLALCLNLTVHDGDSLRCGPERVRISEIDAPEVSGSPKCAPNHHANPNYPPPNCDYAAGDRATQALKAFLAQGPVMIERQGYDRYGRTLARVTVNGRDAGVWLVTHGFAREWVR